MIHTGSRPESLEITGKPSPTLFYHGETFAFTHYEWVIDRYIYIDVPTT